MLFIEFPCRDEKHNNIVIRSLLCAYVINKGYNPQSICHASMFPYAELKVFVPSHRIV